MFPLSPRTGAGNNQRIDTPEKGAESTMKRRRLIRQGEKIPLRISFHERDLMYRHTFQYSGLIKRLRISLLDHDKIVVKYTLDELNDLLEFITEAATHTSDKSLQAELIGLCDRLIQICKSYIEE